MMTMRSDDYRRRESRKGAVLGLCLFGCACDGCLVVGAGGGRPPDDEGGGGDDRTEQSSGVYLTPLPTPTDSASSTPDQFLLPPLGPGQWLEERLCTADEHSLYNHFYRFWFISFFLNYFCVSLHRDIDASVHSNRRRSVLSAKKGKSHRIN